MRNIQHNEEVKGIHQLNRTGKPLSLTDSLADSNFQFHQFFSSQDMDFIAQWQTFEHEEVAKYIETRMISQSFDSFVQYKKTMSYCRP